MAVSRWSRCFGLVAVLGLSTLLGACGPSKEQIARDEEMRALRENQGASEARVATLEGNVNSLSAQVTELKTKPAVSEPVYREPPSGGNRADRDTGGGGGGRRVDLGINLFNSGAADLTPNGKKSVDAALKGISKNSTINVEGFADTQKPTKGKYKTNEALSQARADSVAAYLRSKGYSVGSTVGHGAVTRNGKAPSRRVELVVN